MGAPQPNGPRVDVWVTFFHKFSFKLLTNNLQGGHGGSSRHSMEQARIQQLKSDLQLSKRALLSSMSSHCQVPWSWLVLARRSTTMTLFSRPCVVSDQSLIRLLLPSTSSSNLPPLKRFVVFSLILSCASTLRLSRKLSRPS